MATRKRTTANHSKTHGMEPSPVPVDVLRTAVLDAARSVAANSRLGLSWRLSESLRQLRDAVSALDVAEHRATGGSILRLDASASDLGWSLAEAAARIGHCRALRRP
jgi:hypothetical protein